MQDHEARASDFNRKLIFSFFLLFSQSKLLKHNKQGSKFAVQQSPLIQGFKSQVKTTQTSPFFDVCLALISIFFNFLR